MNKEKLTMNVLFSGIGCQERGFENSNLFDVEVVNTSEILNAQITDVYLGYEDHGILTFMKGND